MLVMVQTKAGAERNEWLAFMRNCRIAYQAHKATLPPKERPKKKRTRNVAADVVVPHTEPGGGVSKRLTLDAYAVESLGDGAAEFPGATLLRDRLRTTPCVPRTGMSRKHHTKT